MYEFAVIQLSLAAGVVSVPLICYVCNVDVVLVFLGLLSLFVGSTFVVDISGSHFLCLNVLLVFVWLTCLVGVGGVPPLSHSGASMFVW